MIAVDVLAALDGLTEAADGCQEAIHETVDLADLAALDDQLRRAADTIRVLRADIAVRCGTVMPTDTTVAGGWEITRQWSAGTVRWDRDGAVGALLAQGDDTGRIVARDTGEQMTAVDAVRTAFRLEPRATALRRFGVNPDLWREQSGGTWRIQVSPAEPPATEEGNAAA